ncbi:MAG TPA: ABC transporter ATP-binding protein [Longimicrobiales bacterium]|nr:ABC transporter ATP-binding protein [Longimicrobiales bacterium]
MVTGAAPLLQASGLVRRYGDRKVVDVPGLSVEAGEVLAIVGPNGAGKSTLFRMLLLLERPDAGEIRLDGIAMRHRDARARGRLAAVFQRPVLFTGTVRQNVAFGLRAAGVPAAQQRERVEAALGWLDLSALAARPVDTLSGGEAQRVALARALVLEPDIVLLDEPTSSLDVSVRRRFRQDVERVARQRAGAVVLITHDATEAFGLADRIAVLHEGRVVQLATPEEIMLRPGSPFVAELTGAELLLHGTVESLDDGLAAVRVSEGVVLWAAVQPGQALRAGAAAVVAYRPEDVTLTPGDTAQRTSAVNGVAAHVEAIVPAGALTRVRIATRDGIVLTALLTRRSVAGLGLAGGSAVTARIKATALHAWERHTHR